MAPEPSLVVLPTPRWAQNLTAAVCARYHVAPPDLRWYALPRLPEGQNITQWERIGHYYQDARPRPLVTVFDTLDPLENRMTLLHEVTHHITHQRDGLIDGQLAGHSDRFWRRCWRLYRLYRVPLYAAILTEFGSSDTAGPVLLSLGFRLNARARAAAALGDAIRADTWLQVRLRDLKTALTGSADPSALRSEIRQLTLLHDTGSKLVARHSRAYRRIARST